MARFVGPRTVTSGLVLCLDAANTKSYPGSGTTWTDLSGNGNIGTLTNGPTYSSTNNGQIVFDGTNDYVAIPHNSILNPSMSMTCSAWIKVTSFVTRMAIFGKGTSTAGSGGYDFRIDSTTELNLVKYTVIDQKITLSTALVANSWYNIVAVQSSTNVTFYINGSGVGSYSDSSPHQTNTTEFRIARDRSLTYTPANIPIVMFYNKTLSAAEVAENFNALRGRFGI